MQEIKKNDRRVIKTKKAIRNAFIKLLAQKDYNEITIKNIADEADVDRKTVYNYYSGIYEIREELENDLIKLLDEATQKINFKQHISNPLEIFEILTDIINSNLELYSNLFKLEAKSYIVRKIMKSLIIRVKQELQTLPYEKLDEKKLDLVAQFITSGMVAAYQYWFNSNRLQPLEELSKEVGELVLYGIKSLEK